MEDAIQEIRQYKSNKADDIISNEMSTVRTRIITAMNPNYLSLMREGRESNVLVCFSTLSFGPGLHH